MNREYYLEQQHYEYINSEEFTQFENSQEDLFYELLEKNNDETENY